MPAACNPGGNKGCGRSYQWLLDHVSYAGDDCLPWPFSRSRGYGQVGINGKVKKASRIMCELVNGPPPHPSWEAAHSCGRGKQGCVNPRHLSWKTRSGNQQDRRIHGTHGVGYWRNEPRLKLTPQQVAEIRAIGDTMTKEDLSRKYGVTPSNIDKVLRGEIWAKPRTRHLIEDAMRKAGKPLSAKALSVMTGASLRSLGSTLSVLCRQGAIVRVGYGLYVLPTAAVAA